MNIEMDPLNPFPALKLEDYTYAQAKKHAAQVDDWLGFDLLSIEKRISLEASLDAPLSGVQMWVNLDPQALQTPYLELRSMLEILKPTPGQTFVDLGCAYGRMAHIINRHYPDVRWIGYEINVHRLQEALRCCPFLHSGPPETRIEFKRQDLSDPLFRPEDADLYFLYDFGSVQAIGKTLDDIRDRARERSLRVVARGKASRHLIHLHHPWLSQVNLPQHYSHFSIYQS